MAAREHKVSRRVLLAAACSAALPRHPELVSGSMSPPAQPSPEWTLKQVQGDERWQKALAAYRRAETAIAAMEGAPDLLFDACNDRHNKALARLLRIPAPHLQALATKLDLLVAHQVWELTFAEPSLAAMRRDARRLAAAPRI